VDIKLKYSKYVEWVNRFKSNCNRFGGVGV
jgi:hypothetical protein